jgi:hypothetical protein
MWVTVLNIFQVSWGHVCENDRPHCRFPPYWYWCWMPKESKGYILTELLFLSSAGFSFFLSWFKFFIEHVIVSILISPSTTSLFVVSPRFFYLLKEKQIHAHWFLKKKTIANAWIPYASVSSFTGNGHCKHRTYFS